MSTCEYLCNTFFTRQHIGLILTFAGTVVLAFSTGIEKGYSEDMAEDFKKWEKNFKLFLPTKTFIDRVKFRTGLSLIAAGTLLQW